MPCKHKDPSVADQRTTRSWPQSVAAGQPAPQVDAAQLARRGITWTRSERVDDGDVEHVVIWEADCEVGELCGGKGRARIDYRDGSPYHKAALKVGAEATLDDKRARIVEIAELTAKRRALRAVGLECAEALELVGGETT